MRTYWIVNLRTKRFVEVQGENWGGEWKERYPHTEGEKWVNVVAWPIWDHDMVNGIPYVYDLCRDGMLATMLVDAGQFDRFAVQEAKKKLRHTNDVVRLVHLRLQRYTMTAMKWKKVFGGHWGEHPAHEAGQWREEVQGDATRLGYWEWVAERCKG